MRSGDTFCYGISVDLIIINRRISDVFRSVFKERTLLPPRVAPPAVSPAFARVLPTVKWTNPKKNIRPPLTPVTALRSMTADLAMQCDSQGVKWYKIC